MKACNILKEEFRNKVDDIFIVFFSVMFLIFNLVSCFISFRDDSLSLPDLTGSYQQRTFSLYECILYKRTCVPLNYNKHTKMKLSLPSKKKFNILNCISYIRVVFSKYVILTCERFNQYSSIYLLFTDMNSSVPCHMIKMSCINRL